MGDWNQFSGFPMFFQSVYGMHVENYNMVHCQNILQNMHLCMLRFYFQEWVIHFYAISQSRVFMSVCVAFICMYVSLLFFFCFFFGGILVLWGLSILWLQYVCVMMGGEIKKSWCGFHFLSVHKPCDVVCNM